MPSEIEAKLKVDDLARIRERLQLLGATPAGAHLEVNAFFDTPDHALRQQDKGLRLRTRRNLHDGTHDAILTFKGPNQPGAFKNREEIETHVADPQAASALLKALGHVQGLSFEKKRESWQLDHCHVELDEIPHLGFFVEIEGPDEATILAVQRKLGLDGLPAVKTSYIGLLVQWMKSQGRGDRDFRFAADV